MVRSARQRTASGAANGGSDEGLTDGPCARLPPDLHHLRILVTERPARVLVRLRPELGVVLVRRRNKGDDTRVPRAPRARPRPAPGAKVGAPLRPRPL